MERLHDAGPHMCAAEADSHRQTVTHGDIRGNRVHCVIRTIRGKGPNGRLEVCGRVEQKHGSGVDVHRAMPLQREGRHPGRRLCIPFDNKGAGREGIVNDRRC